MTSSAAPSPCRRSWRPLATASPATSPSLPTGSTPVQPIYSTSAYRRGSSTRLERRDYGQALTVYFASRYDQIYFKLYALVDQGPGKHEDDLRALSPTEEELVAAARWSRSRDPSEGYAQVLGEVLAYMGVKDVDLGS